jgi:hypothetical protein
MPFCSLHLQVTQHECKSSNSTAAVELGKIEQPICVRYRIACIQLWDRAPPRRDDQITTCYKNKRLHSFLTYVMVRNCLEHKNFTHSKSRQRVLDVLAGASLWAVLPYC